jgi:hypothetical protein
MTKKPKKKGKKRSHSKKMTARHRLSELASLSKPPCKCYAPPEGGYERYDLNPSTGLYEGPYPCTRAECIKCNTSQATMPVK